MNKFMRITGLSVMILTTILFMIDLLREDYDLINYWSVGVMLYLFTAGYREYSEENRTISGVLMMILTGGTLLTVSIMVVIR